MNELCISEGDVKDMFSIVIWMIAIVWILLEVVMIFLNRNKNKGEELDKLNGVLVWIINTTSVIVGVIIAVNNKPNGFGSYESHAAIANSIGLVLLLFGIIIRWIAIMTLNANFSYTITIRDKHELIQSGIYQIIRHPSYTGFILSFLGISITLLNWVTVLVIIIPAVCVFSNRIKLEEKILNNHFGEIYLNYTDKTYKLFPYIF